MSTVNNKSILGVAVAASLGGISTADAAVHIVKLHEVLQYSNNGVLGSPQSFITSSSATWSYDDVTSLVTQTGGTFNARGTTSPTSTLYRILITGLVMGSGGPASASTFSCVEGNFGAGVGASICGNYTFGENFINESTISWGPGTAVSRTLGGDDSAVGAPASIASLDGMNTIAWSATTLILTNKTCTQACTTLPAGSYNSGQQWTFIWPIPVPPIPVPPAAWLFGSALGVMGWLRRKVAA